MSGKYNDIFQEFADPATKKVKLQKIQEIIQKLGMSQDQKQIQNINEEFKYQQQLDLITLQRILLRFENNFKNQSELLNNIKFLFCENGSNKFSRDKFDEKMCKLGFKQHDLNEIYEKLNLSNAKEIEADSFVRAFSDFLYVD